MSDTRELLPVLLSEKRNKIKGSIYHRMQIDFAYNSNHIEGSRLTHAQTRYIYETHTVDGTVPVNDVFEAANHFKCFDFVLDYFRIGYDKTELTARMLCDKHKS